MPLRWIDETEVHEVAEEQLPIVSEAGNEARPIHCFGTGAENVREISAIVTLAFHDERLLPEELLHRSDLHRHSEDIGLVRASEPLIVDVADAVAGTEYQVDGVVPFFRLCQPMWEGDFRVVAALAKRAERRVEVRAANENVEVLRFPNDACV